VHNFAYLCTHNEFVSGKSAQITNLSGKSAQVTYKSATASFVIKIER